MQQAEGEAAHGGMPALPALPEELDVAVKRGESKKIFKWLRKGSVDATRGNGDTLLHIAVLYRQPDVMRELIKRGAIIDVANGDGGTALMIASQMGARTEIELLLNASADVDWQTAKGATALMTAAANNQPEALSILLEASSASVDARTPDGFTALMSAALVGADRCIQLLVHAGADPEAANAQGQTALECAQMKGHASTERLLQRCIARQHTPPESPTEEPASRNVPPIDRRLTLPSRSMPKAAASEARQAKRRLYRASGLLAKDLRTD